MNLLSGPSNYSETPLIGAIAWNRIEAVKTLLIAGADINLKVFQDGKKFTPLGYALERGDRQEMAEFLFECGASL